MLPRTRFAMQYSESYRRRARYRRLWALDYWCRLPYQERLRVRRWWQLDALVPRKPTAPHGWTLGQLHAHARSLGLRVRMEAGCAVVYQGAAEVARSEPLGEYPIVREVDPRTLRPLRPDAEPPEQQRLRTALYVALRRATEPGW